MLKKRLGHCQLFAASLLATSSVCADHDFITEEDVVTELPLVSGAARMAQPVAIAPASVTIIDRQMIKASGALNWVDVFRLVPGFQSYSINGNRYGIDYHGIGEEFPNHLEVMVDGRSVYEPLFSSVEWNSLGIELEDIDRIEVIRGSNVPSFGSNAFLGAINIITRDPIQDRGIAIRSTFGSRDTSNASMRINRSVGNLDYRFSAGYRNNDGFRAPAGETLEDGQELFHTEFRGRYTPNSRDSFDIHLGYNRDDLGFGDPDHPSEYLPTEFRNHYQSIKWQRALENGDQLQLHLYHNRFDGENRELLGNLSELLAAELGVDTGTAAAILGGLGVDDGPFVNGFRDVTSERIDLELEHQLTFNQQLRGVWGVGIRDESIDAEALLEPNTSEQQTAYRLFGNLEWTPNEHWAINGGLMLEHNPIVDSILSPRLAITYLFDEHHSLRLGLARANRSPSLLEATEFNIEQRNGVVLAAIRRAADDIAEEKLDSYELAFVANYPNTGLSFDVRLFREQVRDGIEQLNEPVAPPTFDDRMAVIDNIYQSTMNGVELQLRYQPDVKTLITAHYHHNSFEGSHRKAPPPIPDLRLLDDNSAANSGGLLISRQLTDHWTLSGTLFYQDNVNFNDSGDQLDAYTRIDAKLNYQLPLGSTNLDIALIAQNLGADYSEFHNTNRFGSRYFLQLALQLP